MTLKFNADELFEIAEKIEMNGAAFYRKAAKAATDSMIAGTFEGLASMEDEHRIVFAAMRGAMADRTGATELNDDVKGYLRAIADGSVFDLRSNPAGLLTGKETPEEVLRIAIGLEKDSIIFYLGMRDMVPEKLGRDKIDVIIAEEKKHIVMLTDRIREWRK